MMWVVSTGFNAPTKRKCLESVRTQDGVECAHLYIEAGDQSPPLDVITNVSLAVERMHPTDVCVWLDGDDWLSRKDALAIVARMHEVSAWVTWGSFVFSDGRPGFAAPVNTSVPIRRHPWVTTHLKTFRAGLFQRLRSGDLSWPEGAAVPWDMVVMFAAIEMAGPERSQFCKETLCTYNFASSNEFRNGPTSERKWEELIRARKPYERVEGL